MIQKLLNVLKLNMCPKLVKIWHALSHLILISNKIDVYYILLLFLFFNRSGVSPSSENLLIFRESRKKNTQRERLNRKERLL